MTQTVPATDEAVVDEHPALAAARRSRTAAMAKDKEAFVAAYAEDGWIEDPVGPSHFDPEGKGHHGHDGIANFFDIAVAMPDSMDFEIHDAFCAGSEAAIIATIHIVIGTMTMDTEGVFLYNVNPDGKIKSMRAFWEIPRATATLRPIE